MTEEQKREAVALAKTMIQARGSKGQIKKTLSAQLAMKPNEAGRVIQTAVVELYDAPIRDPIYWLLQDCGESTPLQRRFARRKYAQLIKDPAIARFVEMRYSSLEWV